MKLNHKSSEDVPVIEDLTDAEAEREFTSQSEAKRYHSQRKSRKKIDRLELWLDREDVQEDDELGGEG